MIVQKKDEILERWHSGSVAKDRKILAETRMRYPEIDRFVWEWYQAMQSEDIPVSGPMLQDQATMYAQELGQDDFTASNGWLRCFQHRHGILRCFLTGKA